MEKRSSLPAWKRVLGGFRRMLETELGEEQFCAGCQEFWPLDREFFVFSRSSVSYECKACIEERKSAAKRGLRGIVSAAR
jgi:hypothetical protein